MLHLALLPPPPSFDPAHLPLHPAGQPAFNGNAAQPPPSRHPAAAGPPLLAPPLSVSLIYDNLMYSRQTRRAYYTLQGCRKRGEFYKLPTDMSRPKGAPPHSSLHPCQSFKKVKYLIAAVYLLIDESVCFHFFNKYLEKNCKSVKKCT